MIKSTEQSTEQSKQIDFVKKLEYKKGCSVSTKKIDYDEQLQELNNLILNINSTKNIYKTKIQTKINSYKKQDIDKKKLDTDKFINLNQTCELLQQSNLKCYYCDCHVSIVYNIKRDLKQWSLDRINNNYGHNYDNVVISCLDCNLKRRKLNHSKFKFTKQMVIKKQN